MSEFASEEERAALLRIRDLVERAGMLIDGTDLEPTIMPKLQRVLDLIDERLKDQSASP